MLGIIAAVIAFIKGHNTYAVIVGLWTIIGLAMHATGATQVALTPGVLFLVIAIGMKKKGAEETAKEAQDSSVSEAKAVPTPIQTKKFICADCGKHSSGWYQTCPNCGAVGKMRKAEPGD